MNDACASGNVAVVRPDGPGMSFENAEMNVSETACRYFPTLFLTYPLPILSYHDTQLLRPSATTSLAFFGAARCRKTFAGGGIDGAKAIRASDAVG